MGGRYSLSVVLVSAARIRTLNRTYRRKDASTDVLAFLISKHEGELYFSPTDVAKKAPEFGLTTKKYFEYLLVHGLVHLKGFDHGRRMTALEKKYCRAFGFAHPD